MAKSSKTLEVESLKTTVVADDVSSISELLLTVEQVQFINALTKSNFNIANAARKCKLSQGQFYTWKHSYPHFAKAIELCKERFIDEIEDAFKDLIKERNPAAIMFGLRTLGRERGYSENLKIDSDITVKGIDIQVLPSRERIEDEN